MGSLPPLRYFDGYLPIEDHGLIGDGATAALAGRDGTIWWMCIPRFDSHPLFDALLRSRRGSYFSITPENPIGSRQFYVPDTGVLVTEIQSASGLIAITDALTLHGGMDLTEDTEAARHELIRSVVVIEGSIWLNVALNFAARTRLQKTGDGFQIRTLAHPDLNIRLSSSLPI